MVTAIILAAGLSSRMGKSKMALPWGSSTVLGTVIRVVKEGGVDDVLVVTGAAREVVAEICRQAGVRTVHNRNYRSGEMLSSLQMGLHAVQSAVHAALVVLGDQPGIQETIVRDVLRCHRESGASLVVPSYQHRRGHPWLVGREWWDELLELRSPETPREFLDRHSKTIRYIVALSPSVLQDVDTPDEYREFKP
jgi:molybdenum cofactor cytidylyltransferase